MAIKILVDAEVDGKITVSDATVAEDSNLTLATKGYVDGLIGDIGSALDAINGEVV